MIDTRITIKMIEAAINKGIRDIEDNPKRGIRNLVDLAKHFASGPFQKDIIKLMQAMLANLDSPYYDIVLDVINNVDHHTIKSFGINLGYNSWTYGAGKIREQEENHKYNIPWTIIFDFKNKKKKDLSKDEVLNIIRRGKKSGIYTYIFFLDEVSMVLDVLKENPNCAFVLFVPSDIITKENTSRMKAYENFMVSVLYEPSINMGNLKNAVNLLRKENFLFSIYSYYGDENVDYILSNKWVNEIANIKSPFGILIESKDCKEENAQLVHEYIYNSKTNQEHSSFLIDLYEDINRINKNISSRSFDLNIS